MSAYCNADDVRALLPEGALTDTSVPNNATISTWITRKSGRCDVALAQGGVTLPVPAGAPANGALAEVVGKAVAYDFHASQNVATDPKVQPLWIGWDEEWFQGQLDNMAEGLWNVAATAASATVPFVGPWSPTMDAPSTTDPSKNAAFDRLRDLE